MTRAGQAVAFAIAVALGGCGGGSGDGDGDGDGGGGGGDGATSYDASAPDAAWPGANPYSHATCPCSYGQACVGGGCVPALTLYVQIEDPGTGLSCPYDAGALAGGFVPVSRHGRCEVLGGVQSATSNTVGHGLITATGLATSPISWESPAGCVQPPTAPFVDGAPVTITLAANVSFPDATATLMTPAPVVGPLLPTLLVPGEPLEFGWVPGPADAGDRIEIYVVSLSPYRRIRCVDVPDLGAFKIPADATAAMAGLTSATVGIMRTNREHLTPADSEVSIELTLLRAADATLTVAGGDGMPDAALPMP